MKKNQGITLIALIITIIVLIILAGVTINVLFGEEGIISKAKEGEESWKIAEQKEIEDLQELENYLNESTNEVVQPEIIEAPIVTGGLTPIRWNGVDWIETATDDSEWYNYIAQTGTTETGGTSKWANARTANGSMLVWIPRYEYKITSGEHTNTAGTIEVNFISKLTTTPTSGYTIHPAFTNSGNRGLGELAGIWVGKFENSSENGSQGTSGDKVKIVPNVQPWGNINVSTMFSKNQAFASNNGLSGYDSHMIKNTEWGAVAYLAHSKYGRNGTEVTINNKYDGSSVTSLRTGYAGYTVNASINNTVREANDTTSTSGVFPYNNTYRGVLASTTGNIYGIYDMSGGAWEYVMGDYGNTIGSSGFGSVPDKKYCDQYTTYAACSTVKGDALYETSSSGSNATSWHGDYSNFAGSGGPWFIRGGYYNDTMYAGLFSFGYSSGAASSSYSSRVVCTK